MMMTDSGFDPERVAAQLGKAQRAVILSLDADFWGPAPSHACAKRMFWGVRGGWHLVDHKHRTDNCWSLTPRGAAVKDALCAIAQKGSDNA
jgi:hypothetical protein